MKKLVSLILLILSLSCAVFAVGCGDEVKTYTITLDANGGTVGVQTISIQVGQSYELPVPEKKGYTFKTWMLNSSKIAQKGVWNIESDIKLVAVYEGDKYKVDIYDVLDNFIMDTTVAYGEPYEIKFPTDVNDIVKGLKLKGTEEDVPLKGDYWPYVNDIELEVIFKEVTVVFNLNGGYADFAIEVPVEYGKIFDVKMYTPKKTGALFEYWTYGTKTFSDKELKLWDIPKERVELKAKWRTYTNPH